MKKSYDILIVGGGIIGSSIAYAVSRRSNCSVGVVDVDLSGHWGSSERNAGGVRATWEQPVNIELSRRSIAFFQGIANEVGFQQKGYLWLYDERGIQRAQDRLPLYRDAGLGVEVLTVNEIKNRYPLLDGLEGVAAATFSPMDGLINANLLKSYYRREATQRGVRFLDRHVVEEIDVQNGTLRVTGLREIVSKEDIEHFLKTGHLPKQYTPRIEVSAGVMVNAAGAWAPRLAQLYGKTLPSVPVRRQVCIAHSQEIDLTPYGMFVDTSGLYFHHDGGNILSGYATPREPEGYRFDHDGYDFFLQEAWPKLACRSRHFEKLKYLGGWAGLYEVSPDMSAIIGRVEGMRNIFEAHSFSGRGIMQSYAAGLAIAEMILDGAYQTLNLTQLSGERFAKGQNLPEGMHI